jgi:glycosyltransferase involved in cell wall biosynthesis
VEILMLDNNAPDASSKIVQRCADVRLLREATQGAYAARNRGVQAARGNVIAFTDPDCIPFPDWISRLSEGMENQRGSDVIFVRRVVDAESRAAIRYVPPARVSHQEITKTSVYFRKMFTYGISQRHYRDLANARALTLGERSSVQIHQSSATFFSGGRVVAFFTPRDWSVDLVCGTDLGKPVFDALVGSSL